MKRSAAFVFLVVFVSVCNLPQAHASTWSEKKLGKALLNIDRHLTKKNWNKVIRQANKALPHCVSRYTDYDVRCIVILRNLNLAYKETRRFNPKSEQIKQLYDLTKQVQGNAHMNTVIARDYYYKYLLFKEHYLKAIPLALEILDIEETGQKDPFTILEIHLQLYALYGLTQQWGQEEKILTGLLPMTETLIGKNSSDYTLVATALAENYCIQKKYYEYFEVINNTGVEATCQLSSDEQ